MNWTIVRYNWVREGHNDPLTHWNDDCDTLVNGTDSGYYGVGYANGHEENYYRCFSYNQPSWCQNTWQLQVDCSSCGGQPNTCRSKGMAVPFPDNGWLWCDSTPPDFGYLDDSSDGITLVPAANLTDYVTSTSETSLSHKMINKGNVYGSNGSPLNWQQVVDYYNNNIGILLPQWIQQNPDGIWAVVIAHDHVTNQGKNLWNYISVDATINGVNQCFTDVAEHLYFIDYSPYAPGEKTQELWPFQHPDQSYYTDNLPIDGSPYGECSVWIVPVDCSYFSATSCRLRIRDDCNNWRRSQTITTDQQTLPQVHIISPQNHSLISDGSPVEFDAEITSNDLYKKLESNIKWSVHVEENGQSHDYGPNEPAPYNQLDGILFSTLIEGEDWRGPSFKIASFHDCSLTMKARLDVCGTTIGFDLVTVDWQGDDQRSGQMVGMCGGGHILLEVEPGHDGVQASMNHPENQYQDEVYWSDGPSIPIDKGAVPNTWDTDSLETVGTFNPQGDHTREHPIRDLLKVDIIQARVYVALGSQYDFYELFMENSSGQVIWADNIVTGPWQNCADCDDITKPGYAIVKRNHVCPIKDLSNGFYRIRVEGRYKDELRGNYIAESEVEVYVRCVKPADLVYIAHIYDEDGYLWGGEYSPHHVLRDNLHQQLDPLVDPNLYYLHYDPQNGEDDHFRFGTIDCSGLVNQLLCRLARDGLDGNDWEVDSYAVGSITSAVPGGWNGLQTGDLIIFTSLDPNTHATSYPHIVIFDKMGPGGKAMVWQSRGCVDKHKYDAFPDYTYRKPPGVFYWPLVREDRFIYRRFNLGTNMLFKDCP